MRKLPAAAGGFKEARINPLRFTLHKIKHLLKPAKAA